MAGGFAAANLLGLNAWIDGANPVLQGKWVDVRPKKDESKCFDFGSSGRTACTNEWSMIKLGRR